MGYYWTHSTNSLKVIIVFIIKPLIAIVVNYVNYLAIIYFIVISSILLMASSKIVITNFAKLNQEDTKNLIKRYHFMDVGNFVNELITIKSLVQVLCLHKY